jgi:hypothetical protein
MPKNWIKVLFINALVLFALLVALEIVARSLWTVHSCFDGKCNLAKLSGIKLDNSKMAAQHIGISRFDPELGYVPAENFDATINADGWDGARVTINAKGYRGGGKEIANNKGRILALGDSFTFGAQVSNHETWPACLEAGLGVPVDNAGVFGYGAAQALKRGVKIMKDQKYSFVILSVLVDSDFERDRLIYRSGFPKPALILEEGKVQWSEVPDQNEPGSKYNPSRNEAIFFLYQHSYLASLLMDKLDVDAAGDGLVRRHPRAASKEQIIVWTLDELSRQPAGRKILLLQYDRRLKSEDVASERRLILDKASKMKVEIVDTYPAFVDKDPSLYWKGHHTPLGNRVVCDLLSRQMN